jgi:predicted AAA+ superfamily ATPase
LKDGYRKDGVMTANLQNQPLAPQGYRERVLDGRVEKLLHAFGGVEITGPKWSGKTWLALAHAQSADKLDDQATLEAALVDPALVLRGANPHLVDEWQEAPAIWDAARRYIDDNGGMKGLLLLTGSSKPKSEKIHHSGTGRIARLSLRPMSLFETGDSTGEVSLLGLFGGDFEPARNKTSVEDIARWCCRGGWPSILSLEDEFALETPQSYIESVLDITVPSLGKSSTTASRLMRALALNLTHATTYKTLARDMAQGDDDSAPSEPTVESYLNTLRDIYIIEDLGGWEPPLISKRRVRTKPKRYFVDPSLPAALLGANPQVLLRDMQTLGRLFETLCIRDLRVYLSSFEGTGNQLRYYLDDKNLEVDAIIQLSDGHWAAIEIKLSENKIDEGAANLLALKTKVTANAAAQSLAPEFLMVLVGKGEIAYQRDDGVFVVPATVLAP